jgi:hypothetical protein
MREPFKKNQMSVPPFPRPLILLFERQEQKMAFMMDFKAVWPLHRKDGWTWKPATGLQIQ